MFKKVLILILIIILSPGNIIFSQDLSQQVIVPVAGSTSAGTINYSQTIGETAVEIFSSSEYTFTQGFQQPRITFLTGTPPPGNGVDVYPNPATDVITVKLFGENSREFRIDILNIAGTVVFTEEVAFIDKYYSEKSIPVSQLYKGIYFVRVMSYDKIIRRTFKIEKM